MELREKGMAWRAIADWMSARGVQCSHNEVYYIGRQEAIKQAEREKYSQEYGTPPYDKDDATEEAKYKAQREKETEDLEHERFEHENG